MKIPLSSRLNTVYEKAVANLPASALEILQKCLDGDDFCGVIPASDVHYIADATGGKIDRVMLDLLGVASWHAKPLISNFRVGAVAQGVSGSLYLGANAEFPNEALSFCVHAEQAAVINAWVHGESGLKTLAITHPPCGYCRQFLYELGEAPKLIILWPDGPELVLADLLPYAPGPQTLGFKGRLLESEDNKLALIGPSDDSVVLAALSAANMSYAPYTKSYSGVALLTSDGRIYEGPYVENASFNPSLSPMEAALAQLNLCGHAYHEIEQAVLVEVQNARCSQVDAARSVLKSISPITLTIVQAFLPAKLGGGT